MSCPAPDTIFYMDIIVLVATLSFLVYASLTLWRGNKRMRESDKRMREADERFKAAMDKLNAECESRTRQLQ